MSVILFVGDTKYLCGKTHIKFLPVNEEIFQKIEEKSPLGIFVPSEIPAGVYKGIDESVMSFGPLVSWVAHQEVEEEVIYRITKAFFENIDEALKIYEGTQRIPPEESGKGLGVPMHPGSMKYFDEVGWEYDVVE